MLLGEGSQQGVVIQLLARVVVGHFDQLGLGGIGMELHFLFFDLDMVGGQITLEIVLQLQIGIVGEFLVLVPFRFRLLFLQVALLHGVGGLFGGTGFLLLIRLPRGGLLLTAALRILFLGPALFLDAGLVFLLPLAHEGQHDTGADQGVEDPVEAHQGGEIAGEEEEHQRHHEQHHALGAVGAVSGGEPLLGKGSRSHQQGQDPAGGIGLRQIVDPHEGKIGIDDGLVAGIDRIVGADGREQPDQDRHLDEQRQAAGGRRAVVLLVQGGGGLVHLLGVAGVTLFDLVHFRLEQLHLAGRAHLLAHEGLHGAADDEGEQEDGQDPAGQTDLGGEQIEPFKQSCEPAGEHLAHLGAGAGVVGGALGGAEQAAGALLLFLHRLIRRIRRIRRIGVGAGGGIRALLRLSGLLVGGDGVLIHGAGTAGGDQADQGQDQQ